MADFDPTKPVQTRDGRAARILCTDRESNGAGSIVALVRIRKGAERVHTYYAAGHLWEDGREADGDLVNIPARVSTFYNTYNDAYPCAHPTLMSAQQGRVRTTRSYLATLEIITEGGVVVDRKVHNLLENDNG